MAEANEDQVFRTLNADDIDHTVTEIESCCMNCYKNVSKKSTTTTTHNFVYQKMS